MLKDKQGRENVKTKEPRGKEQKVSRKENREEKEKLGVGSYGQRDETFLLKTVGYCQLSCTLNFASVRSALNKMHHSLRGLVSYIYPNIYLWKRFS